MYAMTTCGSCKVKEKEFEEYGIRYTEYDVDIDKERNRELFAKPSPPQAAVDSTRRR